MGGVHALQKAAEKAVIDWIVGGKRPADALEDVRASVSARGVRCSFVDVPLSPEEKGTLPRLHQHVLDRSGMRRALATFRQEDWRELFAEAELEPGVGWIAAEPIAEEGARVHAMLVVIGASGDPDDNVLLAVPAIARACVPLIKQRRAAELASHRRHTLNNLLAAASANLGFVAELLDEGALDTATNAADAKKALSNARGALRDVVLHVEALTNEARAAIR